MTEPKRSDEVDCMACKHFYITWEPANPRGCRAFAFKTSGVPSAIVKRESGLDCHLFERKPPPRRKDSR